MALALELLIYTAGQCWSARASRFSGDPARIPTQKLEQEEVLGRPTSWAFAGHYVAPFTALADASPADDFRGASTSRVTPMTPSVRTPRASLRGIKL